ncbi:MAG: antitoxin [Oscillospiraceae bacterium]|nr:antitoxin [Oscillospiraceae bacterium]MDY2865000.1 antitoxin [Oscillospiraceae bacterium]
MAYTQSTNKAVQKYNKKAYDTTTLRVRKGQLERILQYAKENGESLNGYINRLISQDMGEKLNAAKDES